MSITNFDSRSDDSCDVGASGADAFGADAFGTLCAFPDRVAGLDLSHTDEEALATVLTKIRAAQRCLDGLTMRVGARSNALAAMGKGSPAAETLRGAGAVGAGQARREARRAELTEAAPRVAAAAEAGELSGEHVDAIARHTAKLTDEQQAGFDFDAAIEHGRRLPPETFNRHLKRVVDAMQGDHGLDDTLTKQQASEFRHWYDQDTGMGRFAGSLDPERYEMLLSAIEQRCASLAAAGDVEKNSNLAAAALVDLVTGAAGGGWDARSRLPSILVVVDHQTAVSGPHVDSIRQTENGFDITAASLDRLACDAVIRRVVRDERGVPINVGRKHRTATDAQWAAIKAVHAECAWDGCTAPISWCQAHHIREWEHGGPTDLNNLIPLCKRHHHFVHEGRWSITMAPDRSLSIRRPNGALQAKVPAPSRSPAQPRAA